MFAAVKSSRGSRASIAAARTCGADSLSCLRASSAVLISSSALKRNASIGCFTEQLHALLDEGCSFGKDLLFALGEGFTEYACSLQVRDEAVAEVLGVERTDVVAVDGLCLLHVEACGVGDNVVYVKVLDELVDAEDVLVCGEGPTQQGQVVQHTSLMKPESRSRKRFDSGSRLESFLLPYHDVGQVLNSGMKLVTPVSTSAR